MATIAVSEARELVGAAIAATSMLGGVMACCSGYLAARAMAGQRDPATVGRRVNEGVGEGFMVGSPVAVVTLIIEAWIW